MRKDRFDEGSRLLKKAEDAIYSTFGGESLDILILMNDMAMSYLVTGKLENAIRLFEKSAESMNNVLREHSNSLATMADLGLVYLMSGRICNSVIVLEKARDAIVNMLSCDHLIALITMS